ncbi:MAG: DNA (cytosine-5-)-methyltransferase [Lachnospiraceae bacterium]|nr:DNA (cytosine-5-)-methyltransferase [Lachnospiraceae bacterium]
MKRLNIGDCLKNMEGYSVKSLFSGAGGLDCGLEQTGLKVVESYEFEKNACDTLAAIGKSNVYRCDISRLLLENQLNTFAITATFPCTHFSTAGLRDGDELYLEAHRIIRCLEPEIFVIENVPAMARFEIVMEAFMEMPGYHVSDFVLNAADCGAPQNRKRLIILGAKSQFNWDFTPVPKSEKMYLKDILEEGVSMPLSKGVRNRLDGVNKGQWPTHVYDPLIRDFGPTCVAHYAKDQGDQLTIDPKNGNVRSFTSLEYGRMQGFPDDYPFAGGKVATLKQIGNAVSPYMAKAIGKEIIRYVTEVKPRIDDYNSIHHTMVRKEIIA